MAEIIIRSGLDVQTKAPVDKRIVVDKLSDLYTNSTFKLVYKGLTVSVLNTLETAEEGGTYSYNTGGVSLWQLIDDSPYDNGSDIVLSRDNFELYWQRVAGSSQTTINNTTSLFWDDLDLD